MDPIYPIISADRGFAVQPADIKPADEVKQSSAPNLFQGILENANLDQVQSEQAIQDLVLGKTDSVQEVVMAVAKAEMSFQLFMEIRNKLINTYDELMRMQF